MASDGSSSIVYIKEESKYFLISRAVVKLVSMRSHSSDAHSGLLLCVWNCGRLWSSIINQII